MIGSEHSPDRTPLFRQLVQEASSIVETGKRNGLIYEPKTRWDLKDQEEFDQIPLETLLDDPYYGGGRYKFEELAEDTKVLPGLWPEHRQDIIELWKWREMYGTDTFVDIEGIGSGKTHKFRTCLKLDVMKVLTRVNPMEYYGLDPKGQGISFVCMSRNARLAAMVTFSTVLKAFDCPFFNENFPPQVDLAKIQDTQRYPSVLRFPKDIVIFPGTGSALSAIGYNLFGGGIDEANYLEIIDESKKAFVGSHYDAAELIYAAIKARMKSRFVGWMRKHQGLPGLLMLFSNTRRKGDFLERMTIKSRKDRTIFCRRRCTWEAQPKDRFCGETFNFDVANRRIVGADGNPIPFVPSDINLDYEGEVDDGVQDSAQ